MSVHVAPNINRVRIHTCIYTYTQKTYQLHICTVVCWSLLYTFGPSKRWIELVQDALPSVFGTVSFKTFSLGEQHPEIREIGVAHGKQNQSLGKQGIRQVPPFDDQRLDQQVDWTCLCQLALVMSKELQSHLPNDLHWFAWFNTNTTVEVQAVRQQPLMTLASAFADCPLASLMGMGQYEPTNRWLGEPIDEMFTRGTTGIAPQQLL